MKKRFNLTLFVVLACMVQAFSDGKVTRVNFSEGMIHLTIATTPDVYYQLQCCSELDSDEWVDLGVVFGVIADSTLKSIAITQAHCFFRVIIVGEAAPIDPSPPSLPPPPPPFLPPPPSGN